MAILKLIEKTNPFGDMCTKFHYRDEQNRDFFFRDTNIPFQYEMVSGTHKDFNAKKPFKLIVEKYTDRAIDQHKFVGGYSEAIGVLEIKNI